MSTYNADQFWADETAEHLDVAQKTFAALKPEFTAMLDLCTTAIQNGNKILFFGNGGSAADAQHLATELAVRYISNRAPIAALALTTDTSSLTAIGNDMGFDHIFARQIDAIGKQGDIAIAISTSGTSPNIITALKTARANGLKTIGFAGKGGGDMPPLCDVSLIIPSQTTARIQEMHITLGQMLCGALEQNLNLV